MMTIKTKDGETQMNNMNLIINENMRFSMKTYEIDDELYNDEDVLRFINESKSRKEQTEIRLQELENENQELKKKLKEFDDLFDEDEMLRILNE